MPDAGSASYHHSEKNNGNNSDDKCLYSTTVYRVNDIYRNNTSVLSFTAALASCSKILYYVKIAPGQSLEIAQGKLYRGDYVKIAHCDLYSKESKYFYIYKAPKAEETKFLLDGSAEIKYIEDIIFYKDTRNGVFIGNDKKAQFLPFMCDVLPYVLSENSGPSLDNNSKDTGACALTGTVVAKSRITLYPGNYNPFFFVVISAPNNNDNNIFKVIFWKENIQKYSCLKTGDEVELVEYKERSLDKRKYLTEGNIMLTNSFSESIYYPCAEYSGKLLHGINSTNEKHNSLFSSVEGTISFISALFRSVDSSVAYNHNNINAKTEIHSDANIDINSDRNCYSLGSMEYFLVRVENKDNLYNVVMSYNSDPIFYKIRENMNIKITELRRMERGGVEYYVSTIYTQLEAELDSSCSYASRDISLIGDYGYIPDCFGSTYDFLNFYFPDVYFPDLKIEFFIKPRAVSFVEMLGDVLYINEVKKYLVEMEIEQIDDLNDQTISSGTMHSDSCFEKEKASFYKAKAACAVLKNSFKIFIIENKFIQGGYEDMRMSISSRVGVKGLYAVDGIRVSDELVIHYITGVFGI
ncbi:hypothetical protein ENBRE01_2118 [Enteropsectra breve]|nr:hypothetical protein ENBRE01_2118 [Enteropsectra breve]